MKNQNPVKKSTNLLASLLQMEQKNALKIPSIWNLGEQSTIAPLSPATMSFSEFRPLDDTSLIEYIKSVPALSSKLADNLDDLSVKEVGDGNLNFVFIVSNPAGSFVIKQVTNKHFHDSAKTQKNTFFFYVPQNHGQSPISFLSCIGSAVRSLHRGIVAYDEGESVF